MMYTHHRLVSSEHRRYAISQGLTKTQQKSECLYGALLSYTCLLNICTISIPVKACSCHIQTSHSSLTAYKPSWVIKRWLLKPQRSTRVNQGLVTTANLAGCRTSATTVWAKIGPTLWPSQATYGSTMSVLLLFDTQIRGPWLDQCPLNFQSF